MNLRNELIKLIEVNLENEIIIERLLEAGFSEEDIIKELIMENKDLPYDECVKDFWINQVLNQFKEKIKFNNEIYGNVSKHDIISSLQHFQSKNVELSNDLYYNKNYVKQLEKDKVNLQVKLERSRTCVKCYECKDNTCINNIYHSLSK